MAKVICSKISEYLSIERQRSIALPGRSDVCVHMHVCKLSWTSSLLGY